MRTLIASTFAALIVAVTLATPSRGYGITSICIAPRPPYCTDTTRAFEDQMSFNSCKRDVEGYLSDVDRYVDCLRENQRNAISESKEVVNRFNCHARGERFCY